MTNVRVNDGSGQINSIGGTQIIRPIPVSSSSILRPTMGHGVMDGHAMVRTGSKPPMVPHSNQHLQPRTYIRSPPTVPTTISQLNQLQQQQQSSSTSMPSMQPMSNSMSMSMTPGIPSSDDELLNQLTSEELIKRIKQLENRNRKLIYDNGSLMKDLNQSLSQLQSMKHHNFQLMGDNNELRDLCCYLDDERSKARTLAKEWQQFSQHMSKVMRHEVSTYATKLTLLENKQFELVRENFELKQLCLMLDNAIQARDDGASLISGSNNEMVYDGAVGGATVDGSSRTGQATDGSRNDGHGSRTGSPSKSSVSNKMVISQQILEYIRTLELKIQQLEWERKQSMAGGDNGGEDGQSVDMELSNIVSMDPSVNCPPAVTEAMRVLRIHESMEKLKLKDKSSTVNSSGLGSSINSPMVSSPSTNSTAATTADGNRDKDTSEQQKAIVRSLCNVAWKKIEDGNIV